MASRGKYVCNDLSLYLMYFQVDPTIIDRLQKSSDYSPLYKILLRSRNDNNPVKSLGKHN